MINESDMRARTSLAVSSFNPRVPLKELTSETYVYREKTCDIQCVDRVWLLIKQRAHGLGGLRNLSFGPLKSISHFSERNVFCLTPASSQSYSASANLFVFGFVVLRNSSRYSSSVLGATGVGKTSVSRTISYMEGPLI